MSRANVSATVSTDQPTLSAAAATGDGRTVPRTSALTHDVSGGEYDVAAIAIHREIACRHYRHRHTPTLPPGPSARARGIRVGSTAPEPRQSRDGAQAVLSAHAPACGWS